MSRVISFGILGIFFRTGSYFFSIMWSLRFLYFYFYRRGFDGIRLIIRFFRLYFSSLDSGRRILSRVAVGVRRARICFGRKM